ncbi:MAG: SDR family oxidoreductase, partial [Gammaproteobacteria bacterium]|nr:SDR family oxidoreductase [Gammaproteobacteria bacterium]
MAATFGKSSTAADVVSDIDLSGRTALVTGVNSGIGKETMRVLAARGAHVIGTARTLDKAQAAVHESGAATGLACELEDLDSIRACAAAVIAEGRALDIIIANAGIMALPQRETVRGIEKQFATNHLGHFLLINLLQALIEAAPAARVVIVSSEAHRQAPSAGIDFDDLGAERKYSAWRAYGQSKLANVLFAAALAQRLQNGATANSLHPGVIGTNLGRHMNPLLSAGLGLFMRPFSKSVAQGAATSCYVATRPEASGVSGQYFSDCAVATPSRLAR